MSLLSDESEKLLGESWGKILKYELDKPYVNDLIDFTSKQRAKGIVYPSSENVFKAFKKTSFENTRVVLLGMDPYPSGQATGLSFAVEETLHEAPVSLIKLLDAFDDDMGPGYFTFRNTNLEYLADQGVLLINSCLTVDKGKSGSHKNKGWEMFITRVLELLNHKHFVVFLALGKDALKVYQTAEINTNKHLLLTCEHPAASAYGGRAWDHKQIFKKTNEVLQERFGSKIIW